MRRSGRDCDALQLVPARGRSHEVGACVRRGVCTYALGYCRQRIGICLMCCKPNQPVRLFVCHRCVACDADKGVLQAAGVCLACLDKCHKDHGTQIIVGTRRDFRCDCGNSKCDSACLFLLFLC